jgi:dihydroorotate dehydrogenase (NAD+) catalytic subunit
MLEALETSDGIDGYEVNVSCPNVAREGIAFGADPDVVYELTSRLARITHRELMIKLSPNVSDIALIAQAAEAGGATSLALINTLWGMAIDWRTGASRLPRKLCGYSGKGIKPVALALTYKAAQAVKIPILAMGGISCCGTLWSLSMPGLPRLPWEPPISAIPVLLHRSRTGSGISAP